VADFLNTRVVLSVTAERPDGLETLSSRLFINRAAAIAADAILALEAQWGLTPGEIQSVLQEGIGLMYWVTSASPFAPDFHGEPDGSDEPG
jgi:hypothetical protein